MPRSTVARSAAGSGEALRIGMMVDLYHPYVSGVTHSVALCRRALEEAGHEVFVFAFGPPDPADGARVLRSPGLPIGIRYGATSVRLGMRHTVEQQRRLRSMDVLHVHHPFVSGPLALRYRRETRQPVVYTCHTRYDLHAEAYLPRIARAAGRGWLLSRLRRFCCRCDRVLAPTEDMRRRLEGWGISCPIEVMPLGVELERFRAPGGEPGADAGRRVIAIFVGRLGPEKNLPLLLDCFAEAAATRPRLFLRIVGDGPQRRELEARARALPVGDRVGFVGLVPYERIPTLLHDADFFITPSVSEVQPLSVLEAAAAGLPVVGFDCDGLAALVQDGVSGYLAADRHGFTSAMARLADRAELRRSLRRGALERGDRHSIATTASRLLTCYERLISSDPKVSP